MSPLLKTSSYFSVSNEITAIIVIFLLLTTGILDDSCSIELQIFADG